VKNKIVIGDCVKDFLYNRKKSEETTVQWRKGRSKGNNDQRDRQVYLSRNQQKKEDVRSEKARKQLLN
jgi:hypothetical protein